MDTPSIDYKRILDLSVDLICIAGMDGYFKYVNPAWETVLGYAREELLSRPFIDFIHPEDRIKSDEEIAKLAAGHQSKDFENRYVHKDGSIRHISWAAQPVADEKAMYCIGRDLAHLRQAQTQLKESELRYRLLFANMLNGYAYCKMIFDQKKPHDFIYLDVNPAFEALTGLKGVVGKKASEVIPGIREADQELIEIYGRVSSSGIPEVFERYLKSLSMWFSVAVFSPEKEHFVAVFDVITERKRAEKELKETLQHLKFHIENSPLAVIEFNQDFEIIRWSDRAKHIFGWDAEEVLGRRIDQLRWVHEDDVQAVAALSAEMHASRRTSNTHTNRNYCKDGSVITCEWYNSALVDETGTLNSVQSLVLDISDRKRAEDALRESEARLKLAQASAGAGFWDWDMTSGKLKWSRELFLLFGLDPDKTEPTFDAWDMVLHADDKETAHSRIEKSIKKGTSLDSDYRIRLPDGKTRWIKALGNTIYDNAKQAVRMAGICIDITERKTAEDALSESEEKYRGVVENANEGITVTQDGMLKFVNRKALEVSGYSEAEIMSKPFVAFVYPEDRQAVMRHHLKRLKGEERPEVYAFRFVAKDGSVKWLEINGVVIAWEGKPATLNLLTDITARRQAEMALKETQQAQTELLEKMNTAQQIAMIGSWEWDLQAGKVWWSDETFRIFGVTPQKFVPSFEKNGKLIHPDDFEKYIKTFDNCFKTGDPLDLDVRLITTDGLLKYCNAKGKIIYDGAGQQVRFIGTIHDITERRRAEKERDRLQTQLANALEIAHLGHWEYDVANDRFTFNDQFYKIFHTTVAQMGGYTMSSSEYARRFVHPDDIPLVQEEIRWAIEATDPHSYRQLEHRIVYSDGTVGHITVRFFIAKGTDGRTVRTYGVNQDITERKRIEEELLRSQKLESIGVLAGGIAHDFNNILSSIIGFTELALDEVEKDTSLEDSLQEVYAAGKRARDLVKQILTVARQSDEEVKPVQPGEIAREALKFIRASIPSAIKIEQNIQSDSLIMGNAAQVHQVLMNLCTNAAHAMEEKGGRLELSMKDVVIGTGSANQETGMPSGDYLQIRVSDTGVGIPADIIGKIYEPYFTTKGPGEGTGIGLAMVHGIIKGYKGHISVESAWGKGTVFTIHLPVTRKRRALRPYEPEEAVSGTERILFVDDEAPIAKMGGQILERLGYSVTTRTSSVEALALFRSKPDGFDLVVTDMTMPNMSGDQLAAGLMKIRPDIPVILCTGYSKKISDEMAFKIGLKGFAYKPIVKADLAKAVRKVLDEAKSKNQQ